jgi:hypothetical protein
MSHIHCTMHDACKYCTSNTPYILPAHEVWHGASIFRSSNTQVVHLHTDSFGVEYKMGGSPAPHLQGTGAMGQQAVRTAAGWQAAAGMFVGLSLAS